MEPAVLVALIMAAASIIVAIISKIDVRGLRRDVKTIKHQTNAMQDEMQRLARAEGRALEKAESEIGEGQG